MKIRLVALGGLAAILLICGMVAYNHAGSAVLNEQSHVDKQLGLREGLHVGQDFSAGAIDAPSEASRVAYDELTKKHQEQERLNAELNELYKVILGLHVKTTISWNRSKQLVASSPEYLKVREDYRLDRLFLSDAEELELAITKFSDCMKRQQVNTLAMFHVLPLSDKFKDFDFAKVDEKSLIAAKSHFVISEASWVPENFYNWQQVDLVLEDQLSQLKHLMFALDVDIEKLPHEEGLRFRRSQKEYSLLLEETLRTICLCRLEQERFVAWIRTRHADALDKLEELRQHHISIPTVEESPQPEV